MPYKSIPVSIDEFSFIVIEEAENLGLIPYCDYLCEFRVYERNFLNTITKRLFDFYTGNPIKIIGKINNNGLVENYEVLPSKRTPLTKEYEDALHRHFSQFFAE